MEYDQILVTGGSGSWGRELTKYLLKDRKIKKIIIYSRNEDKQVQMKREIDDPRVKYIIGDVRDSHALSNAMSKVELVFHCAALKHVPICEELPIETIKTNIYGTMNVIDSAILKRVKKVVYVSSDKAVDPLNVYGMTKALGERLCIQANYLEKNKGTMFVSIRAGNVLGSSGSVVPFFINQIKTKNEVTITDRRMTRYFFTIEDAIKLLIEASKVSIGGEIFVMKMPSWYIKDLAEVLIEFYGDKNKTTIKEIGLRPGEKLDEVLISKHEMPLSVPFGRKYYIILPSYPRAEWLYAKYAHVCKANFHFEEYSSRTFLKEQTELIDLLKKGNFI